MSLYTHNRAHNRAHRDRNRIVRISNPLPTGSRYTTRKVAIELIFRGRAVWDQNRGGEPAGWICLIDRAVQDNTRHYIEQRIRQDEEAGIIAGRARTGGMFFWNGRDKHPMASRRPGEVVS